jgi:hypothetical protein
MTATALKTTDNLSLEELQLVGLACVEQRSLKPVQLTPTELETVLRHRAARAPMKGRYASLSATRSGDVTMAVWIQKPGDPPRQ